MATERFKMKGFMISRFIAALGDQILLFAVPLIILKATGSVAYSGLAFAIEWAPRLILLPLSGTIADRVNVRKLYRFADGGRALSVCVAAVLITFIPSISVFWVLSIMMAVLAVLHSLVFIGLEATLPRQLPTSEMPKAQAMLQGCDQVSQVLGPMVAAIASAYIDLGLLLFGASFLFLGSLVNALRMPALNLEELHAHPTGSYFDAFLETFRVASGIIKANPILVQLMALTWIVNIIYGSFLVLSPAMVVQYFNLPEKQFGILLTSAAVTSIAVFMFIPKINERIKLSGIGVLASIVFFSGAILASLSSGYWVFALGIILVFSSDGLFNVYIRSLRAQLIPKAHLGKTTGFIIMINNMSIPLSGIMISKMAPHLNSHQMVVAATGTSLALFVAVVILGKTLFQYKTVMPSLDFLTPFTNGTNLGQLKKENV